MSDVDGMEAKEKMHFGIFELVNPMLKVFGFPVAVLSYFIFFKKTLLKLCLLCFLLLFSLYESIPTMYTHTHAHVCIYVCMRVYV